MSDSKVALVTGASRGIGACIAVEFAREGYKVVVNYLASSDRAMEVESEVNKHSECLLAKADVSILKDVEGMVAAAMKKFGRIDVLVNNAGTMANSLLPMMPEDEWDRVISVHLKGAYLCSREASKDMIDRKSGCIINISSVSAFKPLVGQSNYAAAKGGLVTLTKSLAKELSRWKIRANCIAPGYVATEILSGNRSEEVERMIKHIPLRCVGEPSDVANLALFLASEKARYITGETIVVDGGLSI